MINIDEYMKDGAGKQARAVLCFLQDNTIEASWNKEFLKYDAEIKVARWENCREQGYVCFLRTRRHEKQLNIAFFEHRNSDEICAIKWEQITFNSPTITTMDTKGQVYKDKYDVSHRTDYGEVSQMASWIHEQFKVFWEENHNKNL